MSTTYVTKKDLIIFQNMFPFSNLVSALHGFLVHLHIMVSAISQPLNPIPKKKPKMFDHLLHGLVRAETWMAPTVKILCGVLGVQTARRRRSPLSSRLRPSVMIERAFGPKFLPNPVIRLTCARARGPLLPVTQDYILSQREGREVHKEEENHFLAGS